MARKLRLQYEGAIYHLMSRGDRGEAIFRDDLQKCVRVELATWQRRGVWARAQEFVAAFLQEQV